MGCNEMKLKQNRRYFTVSEQIMLDNVKTGMCMSYLSKLTNITYSHVVKMIQRMEKEDFLSTEKFGRIRTITMKPKRFKNGKKIFQAKQWRQWKRIRNSH